MFEEPYRWVEAVGNRRQYLDDQLKQGSPIIGASYEDGILLLSFSRGTPKLYEIYDQIGLGGMGHPADLEKLRFSLLDMAHMEGFQRSPGDVTGSRLVKYGLAPVIKQAFEEIFKAPYIMKILLAELGQHSQQDRFFTIDYDGGFEESTIFSCVAASNHIQALMATYFKSLGSDNLASLPVVLEQAIKTWGVGLWHQTQEDHEEASSSDETEKDTSSENGPTEDEIVECLRNALAEKTLECVTLDRTLPGTSKYHRLSSEAVTALLPSALQGVK